MLIFKNFKQYGHSSSEPWKFLVMLPQRELLWTVYFQMFFSLPKCLNGHSSLTKPASVELLPVPQVLRRAWSPSMYRTFCSEIPAFMTHVSPWRWMGRVGYHWGLRAGREIDPSSAGGSICRSWTWCSGAGVADRITVTLTLTLTLTMTLLHLTLNLNLTHPNPNPDLDFLFWLWFYPKLYSHSKRHAFPNPTHNLAFTQPHFYLRVSPGPSPDHVGFWHLTLTMSSHNPDLQSELHSENTLMVSDPYHDLDYDLILILTLTIILLQTLIMTLTINLTVI